jgi:hypothetical protein
VPSIPPSDPAPLRHLGAGNPGPVRSPLIFGLVALLVLVALPLYLLRRPKAVGPIGVDAGAKVELSEAGPGVDTAGSSAASDASSPKKVVLGEPRMVRCVPKGGRRAMVERCEHLVVLEDALARSIRDNAACAPPSLSPFTVSFVLTVDFERKKLHVWPGRSGTLKRRSAADLVRCVEHAIAPPDFAALAHQYAKYDINVMASYPATGPAGVPLGGS